MLAPLENPYAQVNALRWTEAKTTWAKKVDAPQPSAYLSRVMLRRLLACLALITGLTAIGAPVNAAMADTVAAQVGTSRSTPAAPSVEREECKVQRGAMAGRRGQSTDCRPRQTVIITIPTVQFGPDRALE